MTDKKSQRAYIIGGGIAGLAAAAYLISDGGMEGGNITVFDRCAESGGSFDGTGNPEKGYLSRGYRMFEDTVYLCSYDLFSKIPSISNPGKNLKEDFFDFNGRVKQETKARLIHRGKVIDAGKLELSFRDKLALVKFLYLPEKVYGNKRIDEFFSPGFFETNFWLEWSTTLAFQPWHSLVEMRRYLCRFVQDAPRMHNMSGILSAPLCEHDFIIVPVVKWLKEKGVKFENNREITDLEFKENSGKKTVTKIIFGDGKKQEIAVGDNDLVFITNGSMTADSIVGSMTKAPSKNSRNSSEKSDSWMLWKNIAKKNSGCGNPDIFCASSQKTAWESFTITLRSPDFFNKVEKLTGNKAGTGGLISFKDSNWKITLALPHQPYFANQPKGVFVCWAYGLNMEKEGNFIKKKMYDCSGEEFMKELLFHLGFEKEADAHLKSATCIPCVMPYITSQFMPRHKNDRPKVVPKGSQNFAFIGQFVEVPGEIVFTVECSIRSAKIAVKKLLNLSVKIPKLHNRQKFNPRIFLDSIKTIQR